MKKLFTIAFAAVLFAAWTVPAQAEVSFSGKFQLEGAYVANATFAGDDQFGENDSDNLKEVIQTVRLNLDAKPTEDVSVHASFIQSRVWGDVATATNDFSANDGSTDVDVHEAYALVTNIFGSPVHMKAGRQEIKLGAQRIVGTNTADHLPRAFDALAFVIPAGPATIIAADVKLIDDATIPTNNEDGDTDLYVLYGIVPVAEGISVDAYYLQLRDQTLSGGNQLDLATYGLRAYGTVADMVDFDIEYAMQDGDIEETFAGANDDLSLEGTMLSVNVGVNVENFSVGIGYDEATGNSSTDANSTEAWLDIANSTDDHLGLMNIIERENIEAINFSLGATFGATSVTLTYWDFALNDEKTDSWGNDGNVANGVDTTEAELGQEIDLLVVHHYNDAVSFELEYAIFQAGARIDHDAMVLQASAEDQEQAFITMAINF